MSETKFVSRLASSTKSEAFLEVKRNEVKNFLAHGSGKSCQELKRTLGEMASMRFAVI